LPCSLLDGRSGHRADAGDRSGMENAVRPLDAGACGSPRSSFHFSFPSRPKRRDLLWEGPSGSLVSGQPRWVKAGTRRLTECGLRALHSQLGRLTWNSMGLEMHPSFFLQTWCLDLESPGLGHRKNTLFLENRMTSLARARCSFSHSPTHFMQCLAATDGCIVCSFLQGLDLQRRVVRPTTYRELRAWPLDTPMP
jgi:hypothetical protein